MSAGPHVFASFPPASVEGVAAVDPPSSPLPEMESLRVLVSERVTAAVDEILGLFGETVARYREQIDRQRRQLDRLRSEEVNWDPSADPLQATSWIKRCPEEQILSVQLVQTDCVEETGAGTLAAQIKTEVSGEAGGGSEPGCRLDSAGGLEATRDGRRLVELSDTDNSEDYGRVVTGLWKPDETGEAGTQSPSLGAEGSAEPTRQLPPMFTCKVCGDSFQKRSYLMTHAAAHLRDCSLCGKHLEHTEHLKLHLRSHRETLFRCGVCSQTFTLRGNLRTHMRIHSGERPYGCTVCGKSFGRRATLVRHVRSHTGEKPFTCSFCGHGFVEKGNLTVHLRMHTGERPYWCSTCDRRFSQLSCYNKHPCQRRGMTSALINHP